MRVLVIIEDDTPDPTLDLAVVGECFPNAEIIDHRKDLAAFGPQAGSAVAWCRRIIDSSSTGAPLFDHVVLTSPVPEALGRRAAMWAWGRRPVWVLLDGHLHRVHAVSEDGITVKGEESGTRAGADVR